MTGLRSPRLRAILQALLVTTLWSTSWVLVKIGLEDIPAVTFAGLRYFLAFLILIPVFLLSKKVTPLRSLSRSNWLSLAILGFLYYTIARKDAGGNTLSDSSNYLEGSCKNTLSDSLRYVPPVIRLGHTGRVTS